MMSWNRHRSRKSRPVGQSADYTSRSAVTARFRKDTESSSGPDARIRKTARGSAPPPFHLRVCA